MSLRIPLFSPGSFHKANKMTLVQTNQASKDFQQLVTLLDAELAIRDGDDHAFYHQFNGIDALDHVIVAYIDRQPVGCGAFKARNKQQVEIKRMFVLTAARKKGCATAILTALETWAAKEGYSEAILETGKAQIEALSFYPKQGYRVIPNFSPYVGVESSICFLKNLKKRVIFWFIS